MPPDAPHLNQPIVIDNGSGYIKAGIAGPLKPGCVIPTYQGYPLHPPSFTKAIDNRVFVGQEAKKHQGLLRLEYAMNHGIIQDWEAMERLWAQVYEVLHLKAEEHPVLLTEPALNPLPTQRRMMEIFFESFRTPSCYVSIQAVLALYASAKTSGVVLDVGDGVSHAVPIVEGFALASSMRRSNVAGRDVTKFLAYLLQRAGMDFQTSADMEIVKQIKEKVCFLQYSSLREPTMVEVIKQLGTALAKENSSDTMRYQLPDGHSITIGAERRLAPEALFTPRLLGNESPGVHELITQSISSANMEVRTQLYREIVLSGGSTMISTFSERLLHELRKIRPKESHVRVFATPDRHVATFAGGSILATLPSFQQLWVSLEKYKEEGVTALLRVAL